MGIDLICIGCGSEDDLCFESVSVVQHPPDAYFGLIIGALLGAAGGALFYFFTGTREYDTLFRIASFVCLGFGSVYYYLKSTWAKYALLFCPTCRKQYTHRMFNRGAIITMIILVSLGGAVITSAVTGSDDYLYVPFAAGGLIGIIALYFKQLSKPKFIAIGDKVSVISIPGIGQVQVDNPWPED